MPTHDGSSDRPRQGSERVPSDVSAQISFLEQEVAALRRRLADSPDGPASSRIAFPTPSRSWSR